ncbi:hypothetical protein AW736_02035 [Termitidicoccus mucosus]|uniref:Uncharacterized protein n=1 Tax=Termitidicoccus mucosus TaxID=1184151 RepID=A0A178IPH6_9BACT|nr:hypothetical protein AW736_02035 [Opitutaceae bacterium TSB47]
MLARRVGQPGLAATHAAYWRSRARGWFAGRAPCLLHAPRAAISAKTASAKRSPAPPPGSASAFSRHVPSGH